MNKSTHAELSKIIKNISDEIEKLDSALNHVVTEDYDGLEEYYERLNDSWFWLDWWINEQGVNYE